MRETPVLTELEVEPVAKKGPDDGRLLITVRMIGKAKRGHRTQIDPLLLLVENVPEFLDIHRVDQGSPFVEDILERVNSRSLPTERSSLKPQR